MASYGNHQLEVNHINPLTYIREWKMMNQSLVHNTTFKYYYCHSFFKYYNFGHIFNV